MLDSPGARLWAHGAHTSRVAAAMASGHTRRLSFFGGRGTPMRRPCGFYACLTLEFSSVCPQKVTPVYFCVTLCRRAPCLSTNSILLGFHSCLCVDVLCSARKRAQESRLRFALFFLTFHAPLFCVKLRSDLEHVFRLFGSSSGMG